MAWVWVNGRFIGLGKDSRLASTFELTDAIVDGPNERVHRACPDGATRAGSKTRTSGGCPASTAASSWCRSRVERIADAALVPGLAPDGTTGTLAIDVTADVSIDTTGATVEVVVEHGRRRIGHLPPTPVPVFEFGDPMGEVISAYRLARAIA